jgi:MFS family permease
VEAHNRREGGLGTLDGEAATRKRGGGYRWSRLDSLVAVSRNVLPGLGPRTTRTAPQGSPAPVSRSAPAATINPFRVLLTHRNFRLFWIGQTLSLIGTWMQTMAQGWLALELTNNAFLVGLVASIGSLPILVLSLPAGVLADREHKLRLVTIAQSLLLLEAIALWWLTYTGHITIGWLLLLAAVNGAVSAVEIPARQAMMIELVGRDDLRDAIALNSSGFNLARIFGPGVAAAVIAKAGISWCFGLNALSYFTVLIGLSRIQLPPWNPPLTTGSPLHGMLEGIRYIRATKKVSTLIRFIAVFSVLGVPYITLMPVVARDLLGLDASGYGLLLSSLGLGGLSGALVLAAVGRSVPRGKLLVAAAYTYAFLLIMFALVRVAWLAYPILLVTGFSMIVTNAVANSMLQSFVADEFRGRLMSVYSLISVGVSQVFGAFAAGAVASAVGVDWAIGAGAAVMLGFAMYAFRRESAWIVAEH